MLIKSWKTGAVELFLYKERPAAEMPPGWKSLVALQEVNRATDMGSSVRAHTFLQSRLLLRQHLAKALKQNPAQIKISVENGKPLLPGGEIAFSLSHAHGHILIGLLENIEPRRGEAAQQRRRLGVDLEWIDEKRDMKKILERLGVTEDLPLDEAFRRWCEYEARYKCGADGTMASGTEATPDGRFCWAVCAG